jgi:hypothetical protein
LASTVLAWKLSASFSAAAPNHEPAEGSFTTLQSRSRPAGLNLQARVA